MSHISHSKKAADEESDHDWHAVIAVHQRQVPLAKFSVNNNDTGLPNAPRELVRMRDL